MGGLSHRPVVGQARPLTEEEADRLYAGAVHSFRVNLSLGTLFDARRRLAARVSVDPRYGPVVLPAVLGGRPVDVGFPNEGGVTVEED
ncbi:hypothetical protein [Dactylosporangium sp. CA-233914]|uniref:hypothetical protein n=1 Tax=Dactylosporangium sp. CA-233914 TaxID=3239934 RepID=UPI003D89D9A9